MLCHIIIKEIISIINFNILNRIWTARTILYFPVSESSKPIISPSKEEIVLNEGESLEITCTGSTPLKFIYPDVFKEAVCIIKFI